VSDVVAATTYDLASDEIAPFMYPLPFQRALSDRLVEAMSSQQSFS